MEDKERTVTDLVQTFAYYLDVDLEQADQSIKACLLDAGRNVIAVGYYLKVIRGRELFRDAGYRNIWEYALSLIHILKAVKAEILAMIQRVDEGLAVLNEVDSPYAADMKAVFLKTYDCL